jgi:hypothetical protein
LQIKEAILYRNNNSVITQNKEMKPSEAHIRGEVADLSPAENKKGIENHKKAAKHHEEAAKYHHEAAKHHEDGNHEKACESTVKALGHHSCANEAQKADVKNHACCD